MNTNPTLEPPKIEAKKYHVLLKVGEPIGVTADFVEVYDKNYVSFHLGKDMVARFFIDSIHGYFLDDLK